MRVNHKRANLGLISAVTNKGELRWMVLDSAIKAPDLIRFLARLIRDAQQKVFLVLDRLPVHRSAKVRDWLVGREAEIEVFYLPGYSPELNPDEGVNDDLKQVPPGPKPRAARSSGVMRPVCAPTTCAAAATRPRAAGDPKGAGAQQGAAQACRHRPYAQAVEAARPGPELLRAQDIPLRSVAQDHPGRVNSYHACAQILG